MRILGFFLVCFLTTPATAGCERFFSSAEVKFGIPKGFLQAISFTEVGLGINGKLRELAINVGGVQIYFRDKKTATRYLSLIKNKNVDVGCMQINYYWHGKNFNNITDMLNPRTNVMYAAKFLKEKFIKTGSWQNAIRQYHSNDSTKSSIYFKKFLDNYKKLIS
ncbi:MAG: lytic transglycosylase [Rhodospirillaceae bacterium]|nr:lytic transglycosylase [Rhodospirillaceae bacterium]|tara:strand:- start:4120 stop:4611 length:492 start_codon:yes stop_codon:yes gene_type:complete